jgi:hypothetical protein
MTIITLININFLLLCRVAFQKRTIELCLPIQNHFWDVTLMHEA